MVGMTTKLKESNKRIRTVAFVSDGNLAIHVTDIEKAEKFYGGVLGFRLLKRTGEQLVYHTGKITLYVVKDSKVIPFIPALSVRSYEKAKRHLIRNGCKISREWLEDRALYFEDPFGITLDIVEKES
jgi:catechol 2,3-dioxygenase-like lactoylglutathione lyase family enzyme